MAFVKDPAALSKRVQLAPELLTKSERRNSPTHPMNTSGNTMSSTAMCFLFGQLVFGGLMSGSWPVATRNPFSAVSVHGG
jgi:hypothetical protein